MVIVRVLAHTVKFLSFLIVTLSAGLIAALPGLINNPASVPNLLAENLPKASNFFLTYVE